MRDAQEAFGKRGARLVIVGNGLPAMARDFAEERADDTVVLTDPSRSVYEAADFDRTVTGSLSLRSLPAALRALRSGHKQSSVQGDPYQLGGVIVVAPGDRVLLYHKARFNGDHPPPERILEALDGDPGADAVRG